MKLHILATIAAGAFLAGCGTTESRLGFSGTEFQDLPMAVQETAKQQIGSAEVLDIDEERRTGRSVYEITYQHTDGMERKLHVAQDGSLLQDRDVAYGTMNEAAGAERRVKSEAREFRNDLNSSGASIDADVNAGTSTSADANYSSRSATSGQQFSANVNGAGTSANIEAETTGGPLLGTKMKDVPAAVQDAIKQHAPNAEIADIDKETRTGQVVYEVSFREPGKNPKLHISEDGTLMTQQAASFDADIDAEPAGAHRSIELKREVRGGSEALLQTPPASRDLDADFEADADLSSSSASADVKADADISTEAAGADRQFKASEMSFNELPQAVQTRLRSMTEDPRHMKVRKSTRDGQTVYEVKFKEIRISEDGTLIENK